MAIRSNSMQDSQSNSLDSPPPSPASVLLDLAGPGPLHARLASGLRSAIARRAAAAGLGAAAEPHARRRTRVLPVGGDPGVRGAGDRRVPGGADRLRHLVTPDGRRGPWPGRDRRQAGIAGSRHRHGTRAARSPAVSDRAVGRGRSAPPPPPPAGAPPTSAFPIPGHPVLREALAGYLARVRGAALAHGDLTVLRQCHRRHRPHLPCACPRGHDSGRGGGPRMAAGQGGGGGRRADGRPRSRRRAGTAR